MDVFIDSLKTSWHHLKKRWYFLPIAVLLDIIFLGLFGAGGQAFRGLSAGPITEIIQGTGNAGAGITKALAEGKSALSVILADPSTVLSIQHLLGLVAIFIGVIYALWVLFNGASWFVSYKILGDKHPFKLLRYLGKFAVISLVWFAVLSLILAVIVRFILFALLRPDQILSSQIIQFISNIINFIIVYFVVISLSLIASTSLKDNFIKTLKFGTKHVVTYILTFSLIIFVFWLNFQITLAIFGPIINYASTVSIFAVTFIRFSIAAPVLAWARMFVMVVSRRLISKE